MENNTTYSCMEAWKNNETYLITCCFEDETCKDGVIGFFSILLGPVVLFLLTGILHFIQLG